MVSLLRLLASNAVPGWVKIVVVIGAVVLLVAWFVRPPHWADLDAPDKPVRKRQARPPFE